MVAIVSQAATRYQILAVLQRRVSISPRVAWSCMFHKQLVFIVLLVLGEFPFCMHVSDTAKG